MALEEYRKKRDFGKTEEPRGQRAKQTGWRFVIQKHAARRLHYDFRLELDGVLKSWAVPKGPSLNPSDKRLAVHVEDHPLDYAGFEGTIPKGQYGGGTVMVWDQGTWTAVGDARKSYREGRLHFRLEGEKLQGEWALVRMHGQRGDEDNWLLMKVEDDFADPDVDITERDESVTSGRSMDQIAAGDPSRTARSRAETSSAGDRKKKSASKQTNRSRHASLPEGPRVRAQLATLVESAPEGDDWVHEIKYDGYRILARVDAGRATLWSRNGLDWTEKFGPIARELEECGLEGAWLDGEVVVLGEDGRSRFQDLQQALKTQDTSNLVYFVFDALFLDGEDLREQPLIKRKDRLAARIGAGDDTSRVRYSDHLVGHGTEFLSQACDAGLEGIISKQANSIYTEGRTRSWAKAKCLKRQEFVIGGFTEPGGARKGLGALLLGVYDADGTLRYTGKVGTGFNTKTLAALYEKLSKIERKSPPYKEPPPTVVARSAHWVEPELVAEISFAEWTADGVLRHAVYQGLREDKPAREISQDQPLPVSTPAGPAKGKAPGNLPSAIASPPQKLRLTHPEKILYPAQGLTKGELAAYYATVGKWMLRDVGNRPLTLMRCPDGRNKQCFFQKHANTRLPDGIRPIEIPEKDKVEQYLVIEDYTGLVGLVQMGVLEIHVWGALADRPERPDRIVLDFDPDENLPWDSVVEAALKARAQFDELGLRSFLRTTGGKGLHVVVPLSRHHEWTEVKAFSKAFAERMVKQEPARYTAKLSKQARPGKIFIDYLRNGRGATAIGNYSTRARNGATVAVPLDWSELSPAVRGDQFTVHTLAERLAKLESDPWEEFYALRQRITASMKKALGVQ